MLPLPSSSRNCSRAPHDGHGWTSLILHLHPEDTSSPSDMEGQDAERPGRNRGALRRGGDLGYGHSHFAWMVATREQVPETGTRPTAKWPFHPMYFTLPGKSRLSDHTA